MICSKSLANAVGGRTARACDSCIKKRARWYCAADDAFLCQACDSSVHSANLLARRHERVRLKSASLKSSDAGSKENYMPSWHGGFTRKARTPRHGKPVSQSKIEETTRNIPIPLVPEVGSDEISHEENEEEHLLYRVPIFDPFAAELCTSTAVSNEAGAVVPAGGTDTDQRAADSSGTESKILLGGSEGKDVESLHGFLPSDMDLAEFANDCSSGSPDGDLFVLKRIMVERGAAVYLSGLREKYFGDVFLNASRCLGDLQSDGVKTSLFEEMRSDYDLLETNESVYGLGSGWSFENMFLNKFRTVRDTFEEGLSHIARYVESFESRSNEIWLVFHHEGVSLSKLIYTVEEVENASDSEKVEEVKRIEVLQPSKWWQWLKTTKAGKEEMRNLIWQLLIALKSCHDRNITHRDIKPENMVVCLEDQHTGRCLKGGPSGDKNYTIKMRIIDFGSAMDEFTLKHLYGSTGPSRAEQTSEYSPPEAFLNASWYHGPTSTNLKYDMWSVGVVMLELILGTPNVFQISARTQALLDPHIVGWNEDLKELAYKLRSFMELCILIPGSSSKHHRSTGQVGDSPASWKCSEEFFSNQIKNRDPLKIGFPNVWALRLVRQLLLWDPEDRLSVDDALQHPYFQPPPKR